MLVCSTLSAKTTLTSIYTGVGSTINLGGVIGLGSETKYNCFSVNVAIGFGVSAYDLQASLWNGLPRRYFGLFNVYAKK